MKGDQVRLTILDILEECQPHALDEANLFNHLNRRTKPPITDMEFDEHLLTLKKAKFIKAEAGRAGAIKPEWSITRAGRGERLA